MFKKIFGIAKKYSPENLLERMIAEGVLQANPRAFFEEFAIQPIIVLAELEGNSAAIETTEPMNGISYSYVYTSEKALKFIIDKKKTSSRKFIELKGEVLIGILQKSNLGMQLNAELYDEPILCMPDNLRFIAQQLGIFSEDQ